MLELIIGAILGTFGSLMIAHIYYKKSSHELEESIVTLRKEIKCLQSTAQFLQEISSEIYGDTNLIKKHAVHGTIDDPEYPYK